MSVSYTLSDIAADFGAGAKHVANKASPFLTFEFGTPPKIFKSTMVKHGGPLVAWQQPVLLTGASTSRLVITAMTHKSLLPDTTIGTGTLDLAQAAAQSGPVVVQLSGKTGASAGNVQFVVTQGQGAGMQGVRQPTPDSSGVVEGVGGQGRNIEGGQLPAGTGMTGTGQHHGGGMGTGAALGAAGGAAAAGMAARHHDNNRGVDERGMGNERGMGMERGVERGMENERGMGNTGMGGMGGNSNYENSQPGMMQQQPQQEQMRGASMVGAMMPQAGQQGAMMPQGGQQSGMMTQPGQQGGMMPQGGQQSGMMGGGYDNNNNNNNQMVPGQQQGMMQQQQGGMMGGMGNTPQETYEKHAHNVHDHDENETYERRNVG
jgi:hypothetical protein